VVGSKVQIPRRIRPLKIYDGYWSGSRVDTKKSCHRLQDSSTIVLIQAAKGRNHSVERLCGIRVVVFAHETLLTAQKSIPPDGARRIGTIQLICLKQGTSFRQYPAAVAGALAKWCLRSRLRSRLARSHSWPCWARDSRRRSSSAQASSGHIRTRTGRTSSCTFTWRSKVSQVIAHVLADQHVATG
jgi:hypothetical protein